MMWMWIAVASLTLNAVLVVPAIIWAFEVWAFRNFAD